MGFYQHKQDMGSAKTVRGEIHQLCLTYQTPQLGCTVPVTVMTPGGHMDDQELHVASATPPKKIKIKKDYAAYHYPRRKPNSKHG